MNIKYRAWHKELKQMYDVSKWERRPCDDTGNVMLCLMPWNKFTFDGFLENIPSECVELMQWTGLQDSNGKDIYEGDIVESDCDEGTLFEKVARLSSGLYMLECIFSGQQHTDLESCVESIEVAGNIYENPELLDMSTTQENIDT